MPIHSTKLQRLKEPLKNKPPSNPYPSEFLSPEATPLLHSCVFLKYVFRRAVEWMDIEMGTYFRNACSSGILDWKGPISALNSQRPLVLLLPTKISKDEKPFHSEAAHSFR